MAVLDTVAMVAAIIALETVEVDSRALAVVLAVITMLVGCFVQLKLVVLDTVAMVVVIFVLPVGIGNSEI